MLILYQTESTNFFLTSWFHRKQVEKPLWKVFDSMESFFDKLDFIQEERPNVFLENEEKIYIAKGCVIEQGA